MRIVCISDTHLKHWQLEHLPPGDVLIHAGDMTVRGNFFELREVAEWLGSLDYEHKVVIAGNHDRLLEKDPGNARDTMLMYDRERIHYLQDDGVEIGGLRFWGSPWTPRFYDWAFQLESGPPDRTYGRTAWEHWARVPDGIDVLVTHGPPKGILDHTPRGDRVGDPHLLALVQRARPRLHVFGHIHCQGGNEVTVDGTKFVNACVLDEEYKLARGATVVDL